MTERAAASEPGQPPDMNQNSTEDAGRLTGASRGRLIALLVVTVLFTEVVPLQVLMVAAVLPKIGAAFPSSGNSTTWSITILGVVGGAILALIGKAGDLYGKKRLLLVCSVVFVVGTLLCAVTSSWGIFLVGRGLEAVSYGMAVVNYGLLRDLMPRRWIPIAVGFVGTGFGVASIIGPVVSGALTDHFSWRSIFWFLLIYMLVMIPLFAVIVPESPLRVRQRFDLVGAVLFGAGVGSTLVYLSQGSTWGWTNLGCVAYLIGGLAALAVFLLWERQVSHPMLELSLLRIPAVTVIAVCSFFVTGVQSLLPVAQAYLFETPTQGQLKQQILQGAATQSHAPVSTVSQFIHFQGDLSYASGFSVLQFALHVTIWLALFTMVFGPIGGYLARQLGARLPLIVGTICLLAACALWINWHATWQEQISVGVLYGIGSGFFFAAWPNVVIDAVPADRTGISSGVVQVFGAVGGAVGAALLTSILAAHQFQMVATPPGGHPVTTTIPQVYTDTGFQQIYLLLGVIPCAIGVALALVSRLGRAPARGGAPVPTPTADEAPAPA